MGESIKEALGNLILQAVVKKGVLLEAKDFETEVIVPLEGPDEVKAVTITVKAANVEVRLTDGRPVVKHAV